MIKSLKTPLKFNFSKNYGDMRTHVNFEFDAISISTSISGLVVEYMLAMHVTRVRFPADAF